MIDIDAPDDVLAAANAVTEAIRAARPRRRCDARPVPVPDSAQCSLDVTGSRCVVWSRAMFEAALAEHTAAVVTINEGVASAVGELITIDIVMGAHIRRSARGVSVG
ncbi:hypothetical protein ACWIGW_45905 [Nocardia brasiliensis]